MCREDTAGGVQNAMKSARQEAGIYYWRILNDLNASLL